MTGDAPTRTESPAAEPRQLLADLLPDATVPVIDDFRSDGFAFLLLRGTDSRGGVAWSYRTTSAPNREELLGALRVQVRLLERELTAEWTTDE